MHDPCHAAALSSLRWETNGSGMAPPALAATAVMMIALSALFDELLAFSPAMHILLLVAFVLAVLAMAAVSVHVLAQAGGRLPMVSTQGWIDIGSSAGAAAGCGVALGLRYNQVTGAL